MARREGEEHGPGVEGFIQDVSRLAGAFPPTPGGARRFVLAMGERYAAIRLQDAWNPPRFLAQMAGKPPVRFGVHGFRWTLVDDADPARHYTAFVFVGFWAPLWMALLVLWLWELAGFFRYRRRWSLADVRMGYVGIRHGALIRDYGHQILPGLIAFALTERGRWGRPPWRWEE